MNGREKWVLVEHGSQHTHVEPPARPVFPDYLSVSCDYDFIHGAPYGWDFTKSYQFFHSKNLALFKVTSIHSIQKRTRNRNSKTRWNPRKQQKIQGSNRSKDREIELVNEEV